MNLWNELRRKKKKQILIKYWVELPPKAQEVENVEVAVGMRYAS